MIEDVLSLLSSRDHPDKAGNIYDGAKKASWRIPGSLEANLYLELVDQIKAVKRGELLAPTTSGNLAEDRLKNELKVGPASCIPGPDQCMNPREIPCMK